MVSDMTQPVKQVIVMRKDLKMRRGKEIAQGAHASIAWLTRRLEYKEKLTGSHIYYEPSFSTPEYLWMEGAFTKVCVVVNSEQELRDIHEAAQKAGLNSQLIIDAGRTEFNGVPTPTCLAIGPDYADLIDTITGSLKLY